MFYIYFLRNIYDPEELELSGNIKNIENHYKPFQSFIQVSV